MEELDNKLKGSDSSQHQSLQEGQAEQEKLRLSIGSSTILMFRPRKMNLSMENCLVRHYSLSKQMYSD
jgi:hypothetical protein